MSPFDVLQWFEDAEYVVTETFHGAVSDKDADFMHRSDTGQYFYSEHFSAVSLPISTSRCTRV